MFLRTVKILFFMCCIVSFLAASSATFAQEKMPHPSTYLPKSAQVFAAKKPVDDPRSILKQFPMKSFLPKAVQDRLYFDLEKTKQVWAECVGFKAPDMVGKISPEVRPGHYTYKDVQTNAALKKLMIPLLATDFIQPGKPPFAGNFPEFDIVPTEQYYWTLPVGEATLKNRGKARLDAKGLLNNESLQPGYPFPRPSGPFAANQYVYNWLEKYWPYGRNNVLYQSVNGYSKDLKKDNLIEYEYRELRLTNRVYFPPYGDFDSEAHKRGERYVTISLYMAPRDLAGMANLWGYYRELTKPDNIMIYLPDMRRIRKLSGSDSQDPSAGSDMIIDDAWMFSQKMSPTIYPYKARILEEREFLVPILWDGTEYVDSKNSYVLKGIKMMRRPIVVIEMIQQDPSYVYGKRILYMDKETFMIHLIENYNQKGKLYRTQLANWYFDRETGVHGAPINMPLLRDHIDLHTTLGPLITWPASWERRDLSLQELVRKGK